MQKTLAKSTYFQGVGLHTGCHVNLEVLPAPAGHGIVFARSDLADVMIKALYHNVKVTPLNTRLYHSSGAFISTIEHVMAALAGLGINNALCRINGDEVPILDGSSAPFVRAFLQAGIAEQQAPLRVIEILKPVRFDTDFAWAELSPADDVVMDFAIDFSDQAIGKQRYKLNLANGAFIRELANCRTFCRQADVNSMRKKGLALGGTLNNAVVVDGGVVLTPGGMRHSQEPVRHKMLDAVGDLATIGAPILGHYKGMCAGHAVTNGLLHCLMAAPDAWRWRNVDSQLARRLPGSDLSAVDLLAVA